MLPEEALVPQGTEQFVFRVRDSRAARVKVETGTRRDGKVEILAGLNKDDVVVTAGQLKLRDGTLVRSPAAATVRRAPLGQSSAGPAGHRDRRPPAAPERPLPALPNRPAPRRVASRAASARATEP